MRKILKEITINSIFVHLSLTLLLSIASLVLFDALKYGVYFSDFASIIYVSISFSFISSSLYFLLTILIRSLFQKKIAILNNETGIIIFIETIISVVILVQVLPVVSVFEGKYDYLADSYLPASLICMSIIAIRMIIMYFFTKMDKE
jgi:hypothetical protein